MSRCCLTMTCSPEQVIRACKLDVLKTELSPFTKQDQTTMDITVLQEQYNWAKQKQKLDTRVILFRKASNNEEISGKSLVNMVPVSQEVQNGKAFEGNMPAQEIKFDFTSDLDVDKNLWRTHLGIHRMKCGQNVIKATNVRKTDMSEPLRVLTSGNVHSAEFSGLCGVLPAGSISWEKQDEKLVQDRDLSVQSQRPQAGNAPRKFSAPAVFSRQLNQPVHQSSMPPSCSQHYPFPQRKPLKMSEAARKLGLYSSFKFSEDRLQTTKN